MLLGLGQRDSGCQLVEQAGRRVHVADELVHLLERGVRWRDDDVDAVAEDVELVVGDEDCELDQGVVDEVEPGHLAVDPDHVCGAHGEEGYAGCRQPAQLLRDDVFNRSSRRRGCSWRVADAEEHLREADGLIGVANQPAQLWRLERLVGERGDQSFDGGGQKHALQRLTGGDPGRAVVVASWSGRRGLGRSRRPRSRVR